MVLQLRLMELTINAALPGAVYFDFGNGYRAAAGRLRDNRAAASASRRASSFLNAISTSQNIVRKMTTSAVPL